MNLQSDPAGSPPTNHKTGQCSGVLTFSGFRLRSEGKHQFQVKIGQESTLGQKEKNSGQIKSRYVLGQKLDSGQN